MILVVEKHFDKAKINQQINNIKPSKLFMAQDFLGKIKWNEDVLEYQKRLRNE